MVQKIKENKIKCLKCGDIIESKTVHDFKFCSCEACAVDGGHEYLRRCGNLEDWEDMSIILDDNDINNATFEWNSETEYGEPQAWYYLKDGTTIEVCHEEYGIERDKQFYSLRRHCSEEDFENDVYRDTCGVIEEYNGNSDYIEMMLKKLITKKQEECQR